MMLEEQTLYIFDSKAANENDLIKPKTKKKTVLEIDPKNFLLSERNEQKKRIQQKDSFDSNAVKEQAVDSIR